MTNEFRTVSVVGLGYVGLPTAAILATHGVQVIGVDVNPRAVDTINQGKSHIVEPELEAVLSGVVSSGRLRAAMTPEPADAFIVAVPTPFCDGHQPDLSYIRSAALSIAPVLQRGNLVILESTSPVGATEQLCEWLAAERPDLQFPKLRGDVADISMVYCPERVLPGQVLHELVSNDRLIGGMTRNCAERAQSLYQIFVRGQCLLTDPRTAEMAKLSENAYRDLNIAFANELSEVCEKLHINVWDLIDLANRHPRVNILQPGPGVGGHCIAVDPWFIVHAAPELTPLIQAARHVNDRKPQQVVERVRRLAARLHDPVIACLGLSYKPDIDDLRESPAVEIVDQLAGTSSRLLVVEPHIRTLPPRLAGHESLRLVPLNEALAQADIVVLLVNHRAFKSVDRPLLMEKMVVDTRGLWR